MMVSEISQTQGQTQYDSTCMRRLESSDPRQREEEGEEAEAGEGELESNKDRVSIGEDENSGDDEVMLAQQCE